MESSEYDDEELVGSDVESKNWKGIVIALVVIAFILSMIVLAIFLVTKGETPIDPGEPFTFKHLTDKSLWPTDAIFHFSQDGKSYVTVNNNGTDDSLVLVDLSVSPNSLSSPEVLIQPVLLKSELGDLKEVKLSPDGRFVLFKVQPENKQRAYYKIYNKGNGRFEGESNYCLGAELDYVAWLGNTHELLYVRDNSILYRPSPCGTPEAVEPSLEGTNSTVVVADQLYKELLKRDHLLWLSPDNSKMIFATLQPRVDNNQSQPKTIISLFTSYTRGNDSKTVLEMAGLSASSSYLIDIAWIGEDKVMVVWLNVEQTQATFILCTISGHSLTSNCTKTLDYTNSNLAWVDTQQSLTASEDLSEMYLILPDPDNRDKLYYHLASIKVDPLRHRDPKVTFLTHHSWSDKKILAVKGDMVYFLSSGATHSHKHLYRYNTSNKTVECITCDVDFGSSCLYVDATLNKAGDWAMVSCQGPDIPSHHVISTNSSRKGTTQVDTKYHQHASKVMDKVKLPMVEYITLDLESGFEASIKLYLPPLLNRSKIYTYGLAIVLNDGFGLHSTAERYPDQLTIYLAKNENCSVAMVDVRGASSEGAKLHQSIHGGLGLKESYDVQQIIQYFIQKADYYKVNTSKIAVMGYGYGGFQALHTMRKGVANCALIISPLTNLRNLDEFRKRRYMGTDELALTATDLKYSCSRGEECNHPAHQNILLVHGTEDKKLNCSNSYELMRKLQLAGYEFKQQIYPGVGNAIDRSSVHKHYYLTLIGYLSTCFNGTFNHAPFIE